MDVRKSYVKLWPPPESTRLNLIAKMTKNLVTPSIWSRKYGLLTQEEGEENAKQIEVKAFATASQLLDKEPDGDGSSSVELYVKESTRRMIEVFKRGPVLKADAECGILDKVKEHGGFTFDISGEPRKQIDGNEAEILLKFLKEPGNKYKKICFSNTSFGIEAALVAKPLLSSIKDQLTEVDISDFVAGRNEDEALQVMKLFSSAFIGSNLRYLDLSNNALGEKGVRAFGDLLESQQSLEELYLIDDEISEDAAKALVVLIPSTAKLKVLHFHNNMAGDEGAAAIARMVSNSPLLVDFRCSSMRIESDGGVALVKALGKCQQLKKLDLRDNLFGIDAGLALSKIIYEFTELSEIYLSYLNLEDEGTIAIANALKDSAPSLQVLDMAGNEITAKSASILASCISSKHLLSKLNLSENELKDQGAILISKALQECNDKLTDVDMSSNMIRRAGARCLAQALVGKPQLKLLNINGNYISDEGIDEVKVMFKNCGGVLGPLDENDPEGEDYEEEEGEGTNDEHELESKLKGLEIKQEE